MVSRKPNKLGSEHPRLVQAAMDAYLRWRDECDALSDAQSRWSVAEGADAALAFHAYSIALDREEHAAELYAGLLARAADRRVHRNVTSRAQPRGERKSHVDVHHR
jgi:hypothetical protein